MPDFPNSIFTPRETENLPGMVYNPADKKNMYSEDFQNLGGEITSIETVLLQVLTYLNYLFWEITTAAFIQSFSVASKETTVRGVTFTFDGLKMYIIGSDSDSVHEYDLSVSFDISTAVFLQSFSVASKETVPTDLYIDADGLYLYIIGTNSDSVHQYDLLTPFDISSAVFLQSFSIASKETSPTGLVISPDGSKMFVSGSNSDSVHEYDLSTPYDISSATFLQSFSISGQDTSSQGLFFQFDGTKMYIVGGSTFSIFEYNLVSPWDISTAVFFRQKSFVGLGFTLRGMYIDIDGSNMFFCDSNNDTVRQYRLGVIFN